jgi:hypothetical protein
VSRPLKPFLIRYGIAVASVGFALAINLLLKQWAIPAWKKPPQTRLSLGKLNLSDEVLADRDEKR